MKRTILTLFALVMATASLWAEDFEVDGIYYNITDATNKTVEVTYLGNYAYTYSNEYSGSVTIPSSVTYNGSTYSVTSIGNYAFDSCTGLTSVTIGNSVTSIGGYAFWGCTGLTSVTIPNSVTSIDESAFFGCKGLTSVTIGNSVTEIGECAFYGCTGLTSVTLSNRIETISSSAFGHCTSLTSIIIPDRVSSIEEEAFKGCSKLTSVTIGKRVKSITTTAFSDCPSIKEFIVHEENESFSSVDGVLCDKTGQKLINYPHGKSTDYTIPNSVKSIGSSAFSGCTGLTSVTIPNSVTKIGSNAFSGCTGLTSVTIPNSVTKIGSNAFSGCTGLTSVDFNATNCISMGDSSEPVFEGCTRLTTVNIGENVTHIPDYAFRFCAGLTSVTIPESVTEIGRYAFSGCTGLTSVTIPNSVTEIREGAFSGCTGLTSVTIPNSVTEIREGAFSGCTGLTSVTIGNSVTSIGSNAFYNCTGLTTVHFNATNCTTMGNSVFRDCTNLTTVHIGENVTCIPDYAFSGCSGLSEIHALATTPPNATPLSFENCYVAHLYVPKGCKNAYQQANVWRNFNSIGSYRYTVTVNPSDESMGSVSGSGVYWDEQVVALIASANEGYEFLQWSDGNTDNPRTVIVMNDLTLTAQFIAEGSAPIPYQLTLQSNDMELGSVMGAGTYQENEEATLIAIPQSGILFTQWSDGNTDNPRTVTMTEDITLTAQFAQPEEHVEEDYQVTTLSNNEMLGSVTQVRAVIIEATSTESGKFVVWSDGNSDNPRTLYPTEDITLTAIFTEGDGIESLKSMGIKLYTTNGALHIENAPAGEQVTISDLSGRIIKVEETEAGSTRIALDNGVYVVRIANRVVKVVL